MPNTETNGGLSLEALLAAAQSARGEEVPAEVAPAHEERAASVEERPAAAPATEAAPPKTAASAAAPASTEAAEPVAEPSAAVQQEVVREEEPAAPAFDLAAALGYGSRGGSAPVASAAREPEEKFDLASALGYKPASTQEPAAAEPTPPEAVIQTQQPQAQDGSSARTTAPARNEGQDRATAVQERAMREAQQQARLREHRAAREEKAAQAATRSDGRESQRDGIKAARSEQERQSQEDATAPATDTSQRMVERRTERQRTVRPSIGLGAQSVADAGGKPIESYQPTKRDRSAQARAARPLRQEEVTEVAQAIAAENARIEYAEESTAEVVKAELVETAAVVEEQLREQPSEAASQKKAPVEPTEERFAQTSDQPAAPLGDPIILLSKPIPTPEPEPAVEVSSAEPQPQVRPVIPVSEPTPAMQPSQPMSQPKPIDFTSPEFASSITAGAPEPQRPGAVGGKPATMPHKVPVRTTEEIIKPPSAPVKLGVISPEAARHEAEAKKKVQSNERKIVKKVRRFRALGMLLIVLALAALGGAIFLFLAGNAQAKESIEAAATEICEQAGRTITYRYKAADSNGTLCPTTEVATFSAGDVLEQSVITMNTPDFETAAHTLAAFKKQFQESAYVDGRVDGNIVIFTLHMSNERILKVTYTALLMTNTTGCEVLLN